MTWSKANGLAYVLNTEDTHSKTHCRSAKTKVEDVKLSNKNKKKKKEKAKRKPSYRIEVSFFMNMSIAWSYCFVVLL